MGDDESAVETVVELTERIEGLCARRAGGLDNAPEVEALAPLLINLGTCDTDLHDVCVKFH